MADLQTRTDVHAPRPRAERPFTTKDAETLAAALRERIRGEVRFDNGSRALYATDASNYRRVPIGVVIPKDVEDVIATVETCRVFDAPILSRGGGTSLAGQTANVAVVIDFSKYVRRVLEISPERREARVEPGTILDELRRSAEQQYGLTFGPDPATHNRCTLGGMIGNNACGIHAVLSEFYGPGPRTEDNVAELDVLTYDGTRLRVGPTTEDELELIIRGGGRRGEIYRKLRDLRDRHADAIRHGFPQIPRRVSGYNLEALLPENGFDVARALVGTEGTCVTVLGATVKLTPHLGHRALLVLGYPSVYEAADHVMELREFKPVGLEGIDDRLIGYMYDKGLNTAAAKLLPEGGGWLLVEFGDESEEAVEARAREAMKAIGRQKNAPTMALYTDKSQKDRIWEIRESGLGATAFVPGHPDTWPGWEDSAVPPEKTGAYLRDLRALFEKYDYECSVYGHFGQGCIHTRIDFDLQSKAGIEKYARFTREAAEMVVRYGGSLSGEHGDGQSRADLLPVMYGEELVGAFREFKAIWDPKNRMNPGKVVNSPGRTVNLRLDEYHPGKPETVFRYPGDDRNFAHAALRCVGVGKCRREDSGTMCPSYMVLREEKHTTRGRAHLLFEMLQGDVITDGWKSEYVKEALDLCLGCKGCKGECPVNVDVATYKAEFFSHYYEGRVRPLKAYAFGLIYRWAALGSMFPRLSNFLSSAPVISGLAKRLVGIEPSRPIPQFSHETFRHWQRRRSRRVAARSRAERRVVLWPDTFNEHFMPKTLAATLEVLEDAGCDVIIPEKKLCCGRSLYDYGMLDEAKALWRETFAVLGPEIARGTPVVGVEPSCISSFREELPNLFPDDHLAQKLSKLAMTLDEYLNGLSDYRPPTLEGMAVVHGHCHHKSVLQFENEVTLLKKVGLDVHVLDSGCCGMAGPFGYEREKYEVSIGAGERVLLPAVREAPDDAIIVADGFSCRTQVEDGTERRPLNLAEVLQLALYNESTAMRGLTPEQAHDAVVPNSLLGKPKVTRTHAVMAGGLALGLGALWLWSRRR